MICLLKRVKSSTASLKIVNTGRESATKIELTFNFKPQYINLWPVRSYEEKLHLDNRFSLIFDNLSPKDEIGLEILSVNNDLPALLSVRSAECVAQNVSLSWHRSVPLWRMNVGRIILLIGLSTSVYWLLIVIQFLIVKTPAVL